MTASARLDATRTIPCSLASLTLDELQNPMASTRARMFVARDEGERSIRSGELITRLVDTLIASFTLTEYERQVVHQALFGRSSVAIAQRLRIRETTVHKHMHRIYAKTRTDGRAGLYALALGLAARRSSVAQLEVAAPRFKVAA